MPSSIGNPGGGGFGLKFGGGGVGPANKTILPKRNSSVTKSLFAIITIFIFKNKLIYRKIFVQISKQRKNL